MSPCPFCGSDKCHTAPHSTENPEVYHPYCKECGATSHDVFKTPREAKAWWNRSTNYIDNLMLALCESDHERHLIYQVLQRAAVAREDFYKAAIYRDLVKNYESTQR